MTALTDPTAGSKNSHRSLDAVLIVIGDEILGGHTVDQNASWLASRLQRRGVNVSGFHVVGDSIDAIAGAVRLAVDGARGRLIVTTGGVGPTPDDVTYQGVAAALDQKLVTSERIRAWVDTWCPTTGEEAHSSLLRMAHIPQDGWLLAPEELDGPLVAIEVAGGMRSGGSTVVMLPGSPALVQRLFAEGVETTLLRDVGSAQAVREIEHSMPEALLGPVFRELGVLHADVRLGSYPGTPMMLRLSGRAEAVAGAARDVERLLAEASSQLGTAVVQEPDQDVEGRVVRAAETLAAGGMIIVVDADERENEGDLVVAAAKISEEQMAFIVRHTSGIVCTPMSAQRADRLGLEPMTLENTDVHGTAFTVSVDHVATGTGVSAADRVRTARALADTTARPEEFRRPGHVFPLRARGGGVLKRAGHTEAAVDLLELAGVEPVGVIAEITSDDGRMLEGSELRHFAERHGLPILAIEDLVRYRRRNVQLVTRSGKAPLATRYGDFDAIAYTAADGYEHLALVMGDVGLQDGEDVLVRIHSECLTGDVMGSLRCDCGTQLQRSLEMIAAAGAGVVVYLRGQEGRGIGLGHKLRTYVLQQQGYDTVDANVALGLPIDDRDYGVGAQILIDLGVRRLRLITNNPAKYSGLQGYDLKIVGRVGLQSPVTKENLAYLRTKRDRMGHDIDLDPVSPIA